MRLINQPADRARVGRPAPRPSAMRTNQHYFPLYILSVIHTVASCIYSTRIRKCVRDFFQGTGKMVFNIFLFDGIMLSVGGNEMAGNIFEIFRLSLTGFGDGLIEGGGLVLGAIVVVCITVMFLCKGIMSWAFFGVLSLIALSSMMTNGEIGLHEAISDFFIIAGLFAMTVFNIIAIITGKYWRIKTNLIGGGIMLGIGLLVGAFM